MTEFERQYWKIKQDNWDVVIFFKKGKFYELYEVDADVGHREFNLKVTDRVNMRMVGVPESSFTPWAKQFLYKGYKIGRVEQMEHRQADQKGIVQRELCQIITLGTLTEEEMLIDSRPNFLLSLKEGSDGSFGICFVDASRGEFHLGSFTDSASRCELATLLHRTKPKEIVLQKDNLSKVSLAVIQHELGTPIINRLTAESEFLDAASTLRLLQEQHFQAEFPAVVEQFRANELVISALGGCLWYLQRLKLADELFSLNNFLEYNKREDISRFLVVDGNALANLEVLECLHDRSTGGTLLQHLDHCMTPFGRRLFKIWVCNPLASVADIRQRQDAVEDLLQNPEARKLLARLKGVPDLERLIARIFAGGRKGKKVAWVDMEVASKKQVSLLQAAVKGFRKVYELYSDLESLVGSFTSPYLRSLCLARGSTREGTFPDLARLLDYFENCYDVKRAKEDGIIIPNPGVNKEYDAAIERLAKIESEISKILLSFRKRFDDNSIVYRAIGKETHQIEISKDTLACNELPRNFRKMSETKTCERFWTPEIEAKSKLLKEEQLRRDTIIADVVREIMSQFGQEMASWQQCCRVVAELDCLQSLAVASMDEGMCKPVFLDGDDSGGSVLEARSLRHPCVRPAVLSGKSSSIVPNDVNLGHAGHERVVLLTGPNMGGKSTVMRSVAVGVIMAQLGCYVCATEFRLTAVDRIFTRIGASDKLLSGQSTFMVELEETSSILKHATEKSLVIIDELGRGTSTFDGYAIAFGTLKYIAESLGCRTLFSTHYYLLSEDMAIHCAQTVAAYHMHYSLDPESGDVTFLYKYQRGVCQKSYGLDVARKAGLSAQILGRAHAKSAEFEQSCPLSASFRNDRKEALLQEIAQALNAADPATCRELQQRACSLLASAH
eukprot:NODE_104_length_3257_cov_29.418329_g94_i0.p1 GENE.NODE_104_length_3257_cov_29.418329_g94_i0~~NODE_104_length_3257_cov_29.418329_g94_i0.p1  ORF type:complete len:1028 (-),score=240.60 NODE_104_length_3257_cov_29.418329_g94_i0:172-2868(-)